MNVSYDVKNKCIYKFYFITPYNTYSYGLAKTLTKNKILDNIDYIRKVNIIFGWFLEVQNGF